MKALVSGITGFTGGFLSAVLQEAGAEVYGIIRRNPSGQAKDPPPGVTPVYVDLSDGPGLSQALAKVQPQQVYHLAAQQNVALSWANPGETFNINVVGTVNLLNAVREAAPQATVIISGSSEEYGLIQTEELPVREDNRTRPLTPYGISKLAQSLVAYLYYRGHGLKVIRSRTFSYTGPGQAASHVIPALARQVAAIEAGKQVPVLEVGNLEACRDFSDVRDVVRAYMLMATTGVPGEIYNVASGRSISIKEILEQLLQLARVKIEIRQDPTRMRPTEIPVVRGDVAKARRDLGWTPTIPFQVTLQDTLEYWRQVLAPQ